jgi:hypothetical protein
MSPDLLTQLAEYGTYCEERQGSVDANDVFGSVVPMPAPVHSTRAPRGWLVAAAAAALVLILIGGLALLAPFGGSAPVVDEPMVTTIPSEIVVTTAPTVEEVVEATVTTLLTVPAPPPGEGPQLQFTQIESPTDDGRGMIWFNGSLNAFSWDGEVVGLYRSVDGFDWDLIRDSGGISRWGGDLKTDGTRLVNVVGTESYGSCMSADDAITINTSVDGITWTSSEIKLPLPDTSSKAGCFTNYGTEFAVGSQGIVVTASVTLDVGGGFTEGLVDPDDGIHVEVVEIDVDQGVVTIQYIDEESGEVVDTVEVDGFGKSLIDLLDAMALDPAWSPLAATVVAQLADPEWIDGASVTRGFAWFSADGITWTQIEGSGALDGGEFVDIVPTHDGFWASHRVLNERQSTYLPSSLWKSTDGVSWTNTTADPGYDNRSVYGQSLGEWNGRVVTAAASKGVWTVEDTPQQLISTSGTGGLANTRIGDFGFIAVPSERDGGGTEVVFSEDGSTWNRWSPPEFGTEFGTLYPRAIGDDLVVLRLIQESGTTFWIGRLP